MEGLTWSFRIFLSHGWDPSTTSRYHISVLVTTPYEDHHIIQGLADAEAHQRPGGHVVVVNRSQQHILINHRRNKRTRFITEAIHILQGAPTAYHCYCLEVIFGECKVHI